MYQGSPLLEGREGGRHCSRVKGRGKPLSQSLRGVEEKEEKGPQICQRKNSLQIFWAFTSEAKKGIEEVYLPICYATCFFGCLKFSKRLLFPHWSSSVLANFSSRLRTVFLGTSSSSLFFSRGPLKAKRAAAADLSTEQSSFREQTI